MPEVKKGGEKKVVTPSQPERKPDIIKEGYAPPPPPPPPKKK